MAIAFFSTQNCGDRRSIYLPNKVLIQTCCVTKELQYIWNTHILYNSDSMQRISSRLQSPWTVIVVLASLLLPVILSMLLVGIGNLLGCQISGSPGQMCYVLGLNAGQTITRLIDLTWRSMALGMFHIPFVSMGLFAGLFMLIRWCCPRRILMPLGIGSIWYVGFVPTIAGFVFVWFVGNAAQCSLNAGGVGDCYLFGFYTDGTFHYASVLPFAIFLLVPLCGVLTGVYYGLIRQYGKN